MDDNEVYDFQILSKPIPSLKNKDFTTLLEKWNLDPRLECWTFSFNKHFNQYNVKGFAHSFLTNAAVRSVLNQIEDLKVWEKDVPLEHVKVETLNCSVTSMKFFDRLKEDGVVRESGSISKCFDEIQDGITISDELRKMLLMEDSINFESFSDDDRMELMFRLFKMFVIGGPICQYEDNIKPYLEITKSFYKDLVCVQKIPDSEELKVISHAVQISLLNEKKKKVFPPGLDHEQTFAFLIIDPLKRHVRLFYNSWGQSLW